MQNPLDEQILEVLEYGLVLSPKVIAMNIDYNRSNVNKRLSELTEYGLVERIQRGYYEITPLGEQWLAGEVDASDLSKH